MTRLIKTLFAVLMLTMTLCVAAQAVAVPETGTFADFQFVQRDGFTTVITDVWGRSSTFDGVLLPGSLEQHRAVEQMAAYSICRGEDVVLSVQLHDIVSQNRENSYSGSSGRKETTNGFYSIELLVGDGYTAFLTGLSPQYIDEMQSDALDAILNDTTLDLPTLDPGVYKVTATISTESKEAYLSNNTLTRAFYVSNRARENDNLSFFASAVYDGAPVQGY